MNTVFFRVFAGVSGALLLFSLIGIISFQLLNSVRYLQYREERVGAIFQWIKEEPALRLTFLQSIAPEGVFLQTQPLIKQRFSRIQQERLQYGQVLVKLHKDGLLACSLLDEETVLNAYFADLPLLSTVLAAKLIALQIRTMPGENQPQALANLAGFFQLTPKLTPVSELAELSADKNREFTRQGWVALPLHGSSGSALVVAFDQQSFLKFDSLPEFDPWAWPVVMTLIVTGIICLGGTLFLLLENLERRLRKLESVASRIARGELDARIDDDRFDSVGRLGSVFNQMADHIQRLVAVQREMIHAVSHELRTPVARIRFGVQMIEDSTDEASRDKQLAGIDHDIQELNELIDEILTYARLEQGGPVLDFQETDILAIIRQVVKEQQSIKPEILIESEISEDSEYWKMSEVEPRYIHRSVQNLVGNAARYAKSTVIVRVSSGSETCRIDVEDDGSGVPESDWEKVFTAFARLDDSRTRSSGGYGLGLSIVRQILYWHGGQAFLGRSDRLGGARFTLVWPRLQE